MTKVKKHTMVSPCENPVGEGREVLGIVFVFRIILQLECGEKLDHTLNKAFKNCPLEALHLDFVLPQFPQIAFPERLGYVDPFFLGCLTDRSRDL
jgi:hypothetical protein